MPIGNVERDEAPLVRAVAVVTARVPSTKSQPEQHDAAGGQSAWCAIVTRACKAL